MGAVVKLEQREPESIYVLARQALEKAKGDRESAIRWMRTWLNANTKLREELLADVVNTALWGALAHVNGNQRTTLRRSLDSGKDNTRGLERIALYNQYYYYPLPGGKILGEATKRDLLSAADFNRKRAKTFAQEAMWFERIAKKMPDSRKQVQAILSEDDLIALRK